MQDDLKERLRRIVKKPYSARRGPPPCELQMLDRIASLEAKLAEKDAQLAEARAENEKLREALTPFAKSGDLLVWAGNSGDFWAYRPAGGDEYGITGGHLLATSAALRKVK